MRHDKARPGVGPEFAHFRPEAESRRLSDISLLDQRPDRAARSGDRTAVALRSQRPAE
jgi:hypothetical protein